MAYNKAEGLVYIPAMEAVQPYSTDPNFQMTPGRHWNLGQGQPFGKGADTSGLPAPLLEAVMKHLMRGKLIAWDPVAQQARWQVEHKTLWNGGVLTTASGLVFQGNGERQLVAYGAADGERLWSVDTGTGIVAPPITYQIDGVQYVAVLAGWGGVGGLSLPQLQQSNGTSRLLVYRLGGTAQHPIDTLSNTMAQAPPVMRGTAESIERGATYFAEHCLRCHGANVGVGGILPDLRFMQPATHQLFEQIVLGGLYNGIGMVSFADVLQPQQVDDIHNYLIDAANQAWQQQQADGWWHQTRLWFYDVLGRVVAYFSMPVPL